MPVSRNMYELVDVSIEDLRYLTADAAIDEETAPRRELDRLASFQQTIDWHETSQPTRRVAMLKSDLLWLVDAGNRELPPSVDTSHERVKTAELVTVLDAFELRANASPAERKHHKTLSRCIALRPSKAMQKVDCLVRHELIGWARMQASKQAKRKIESPKRSTTPPADPKP